MEAASAISRVKVEITTGWCINGGCCCGLTEIGRFRPGRFRAARTEKLPFANPGLTAASADISGVASGFRTTQSGHSVYYNLPFEIGGDWAVSADTIVAQAANRAAFHVRGPKRRKHFFQQSGEDGPLLLGEWK
jgi:hypothetical protein